MLSNPNGSVLMEIQSLPIQSRKKPSWTQCQQFSSEAVTVICDVLSRWNWNQVYFIQDICEIKNIMLLFYLGDIVRKDVIWLLKPLGLCGISRLKLTIQIKASLSLWFVIWTGVSCHGHSTCWARGVGAGKASDCPAIASHLTPCCCAFSGVLGSLFFLCFLMTSKPGDNYFLIIVLYVLCRKFRIYSYIWLQERK